MCDFGGGLAVDAPPYWQGTEIYFSVISTNVISLPVDVIKYYEEVVCHLFHKTLQNRSKANIDRSMNMKSIIILLRVLKSINKVYDGRWKVNLT